MAQNTYVALKTYTVSSATPSVTLDLAGISGYKDLVLIVNGGLTTANQSFRFNVGNGTVDGGNNYSYTYLAGNGSSSSSSRQSNTNGFNAYHAAGQSDANLKNNAIVYFQNYANTSIHKTIMCRGNTDLETAQTVAIWRNTAAIDLIYIGTTSGNLAAGTTLNLYGIASADTSAKATGGAIYQDSNYFYHLFAANGTFTPSTSLTADVLVVAGGGSGGSGYAGGGGAGGLCFQSGRSLSATGYTVTVGAGGASANTGGYYAGNSGGNSVFDTITALGGGGGGAYSGASATSGGSGGGAGMSVTNGQSLSGASATQGTSGGATGYGNAGGSSLRNNPVFLAGGGGGAGTVGGNASGTLSGNGGAGLNTWSSWTLATGAGDNGYFAGGGGGGAEAGTNGTGGLGGGGKGGLYSSFAAANGLANTGGGGGGVGGNTSTSGAGGSGLVIVRYAK